MKRQFLIFILIAAGIAPEIQAQKPNRIAYIDMEFILANVPEYQEASAQLDQRVQQWRDQIEQDLQRVEEMRISLEQERPLLTKELIAERQANIDFEASKVAEYQQKRFGTNGDFILQKKRLIQPIQDQVFNAIQQIGEQRNYDFIFDRTSNVGMVFSAERHNISDQVLRAITRASGRKQLNSRDEKRQLEAEENLSPEEDTRRTEKQEAVKSAKKEREFLIEQRKKERDSLRAIKQQEYDERRAKVLAERNRRKDSIENVKNQRERNKQ